MGTQAMKYTRREAKAYARDHMRGIWAAALTPFDADRALAVLQPARRLSAPPPPTNWRWQKAR